jgi:hypothetical protein
MGRIDHIDPDAGDYVSPIHEVEMIAFLGPVGKEGQREMVLESMQDLIDVGDVLFEWDCPSEARHGMPPFISEWPANGLELSGAADLPRT